MSLTFDAAKHGPAIWKLQGLKWREADMGEARIFQGWDVARLSLILALDTAAVEGALGMASDPIPTPAPADPSTGLTEPSCESRGLRAGLDLISRPMLTLYPLASGGFTPVHALAARPEHHPIYSGSPAQIVAVAAGQALVRLSTSGEGEYQPDRLVTVAAERLTNFFHVLPGQEA